MGEGLVTGEVVSAGFPVTEPIGAELSQLSVALFVLPMCTPAVALNCKLRTNDTQISSSRMKT